MKKLLLTMMISLFSISAYSFTLVEVVIALTPQLESHFAGGDFRITNTFVDRAGTIFATGSGTTADGSEETFHCESPSGIKFACNFAESRR